MMVMQKRSKAIHSSGNYYKIHSPNGYKKLSMHELNRAIIRLKALHLSFFSGESEDEGGDDEDDDDEWDD